MRSEAYRPLIGAFVAIAVSAAAADSQTPSSPEQSPQSSQSAQSEHTAALMASLRADPVLSIPALPSVLSVLSVVHPDAEEPSDPPVRIRFNFKGATFDQVIDFFSRTTGLPVVKQADVPDEPLDFLSPESYDLPDALRVLNIILHSRGVMLRVSDDMLYLQKLDDVQRTDLPTFVGQLPMDVTSEQIVTVVRPLNIALAKPLAERLAEMVASYGAVAALEQQNSIVITETAAQVRRLLRIVDELDRADPEGAIEIFRIKHAKASDLVPSIEALMSEKIEVFALGPNNQQVKRTEDVLKGISISADDRTNSIIAKGSAARIEGLREALTLLDVPATAGGRTIRTISLGVLSPADAARRLNEVYQKLPAAERPAILPLNEFGQVTIVGSDTTIAEGVALLKEIDGGADDSPGGANDRQIIVAMLEHAEPDSVSRALQGLLNSRQLASTKFVAGPDGRSIIISGPAGDVQSVQSVIPALDRPLRVDRQVRVVRLTTPEPEQSVDRARDLFERQSDEDETDRLHVGFDAASRTVTLIGPAALIDRFNAAMRAAEDLTVVDRETRQFELEHAAPSRVIEPLRALGRQLIRAGSPALRAGSDDDAFIEPELTAVDPLDLLLLTAPPAHFAVYAALIDTLDRPGPDDYQFRIFPLTGIDEPKLLMERAGFAYEHLAKGREEVLAHKPNVELDEWTGQLIISGRAESVRTYEQALSEARQLLPPSREGRMIALRQARAADIIEPLREILEKTSPIATARTIPAPVLEAVERTNSLYVVAEPAQHETIARLAGELDRVEQTDLPPMRLIQVRAADAAQISRLLRERYDSRPQEQRREQPVDVSHDAATNTLVVTAHEDLFGEIRSFVDEINRAGEREAERETMIFPLRIARAADVATALDRLFPEPPMPRDRLNRPMPHLQEPREVHVAADAGTNTLIIEAPTERRASFEALVERLDRVELPPAAQLRTYHIKRGDPNRIAETLRELARQGVMSERGDDGQRVEVAFHVEPTSRTLIVAGDLRTFEKTEEMLSDLQAVPIERSLRVFDMAGADVDPETIAQRAKRLYQEQTAEIPGAGEVSVEVDRESGTLLVMAEDEAMFRFAQILNQLQESTGPPADVRLIALEHADAEEVAEFLRGVSRDHRDLSVRGEPTYTPIERTNSILVAARADQHQLIAQLVRSLDVLEEADMPPLRILQLRAADAENIAGALMRQYSQRPADERAAKRVSITADAQTNSLIVAAHPDVLPEIQAIVEELNLDRRDYDGREIRIFPVKVARAEDLARTIDEMFPEPPMPVDRLGRPMPHLRQPREVVVRGDRHTNSLIVDAPIQRMVGFEQLVEQLDRQQFVEGTEVRTYRVLHADLSAVAGTLRELAAAGSLTEGPAGAGRVPVTISTEPMTRSLVVSGPLDAFDRVEGVLNELNVKRTAPPTTLRFFHLTNVAAENLATMLRPVLTARIDEDVLHDEFADLPGLTAESLLQITADRDANALILSAPAAIMQVAEQLIRQLDDSMSAAGVAATGSVDIRIFQLRQAEAPHVATAVRAAMDAKAASATPAVRAALARNPASITAEPSSNSIVVAAAPQQMAEIEALIGPLDQGMGVDRTQVRTVFLKHARAERVAPIVQQLLAGEEIPIWIRMDAMRRNQPMPDTGPDVRVAADQRLNAVVISAPLSVLNIAEEMVGQLDVDPREVDEVMGRSVRVLMVENADANDLALNIQHLFDETDSVDAPPTVRVDGNSNTLLIRATDVQFRTIEQVVAGIDQATMATSRQVQMIPIDPAKASAADVARTLQRMIESSRGSAVEVITLEELLKRQQPAPGTADAQDEQPSSDRKGAMLPEPIHHGGPRRATEECEEGLSASVARRTSDREGHRALTQSHPSFVLLRGSPWPSVVNRVEAGTRQHESSTRGRVDADLWFDLSHWSPPGARRSREGRLTRSADGGAVRAAGLGTVPALLHATTLSLLSSSSPSALPAGSTTYKSTSQQVNTSTNTSRGTAPGSPSGDPIDAPGGLGTTDTPPLTIAVDEATNSLIVVGPPRAVDRLRLLAQQVQDQIPSAPGTVRFLAMPEAVDVGAFGRLLNQTLAQMTPAGGQRGDYRNRVSVIPDAATNSLIITCNDVDFGAVGNIIAALSQPAGAQEVIVKVYPLRTINADRAAASVRGLIEPDQPRPGQRGLRGRGWQEQRMRDLAITLLAEDKTIEAVFDPERIRVSSDAHTNSLIVMGPAEAIGFIDQYIEFIDQTRIADQTTLKVYRLRHARATEIRNTFRGLFQSRFRAMRDRTGLIEPEFAVDDRTNTLIVTASPEHLAEIDTLLTELDQQLGDAPGVHSLRSIELVASLPSRAAQVLQQVVLGADHDRRATTMIVADDNSGMLLVRAPEDVNEEIDRVLKEIDRDAAREFEVRTIVLERANAQAVAGAIQRLFDDRARIASAGRGRREQGRRISIIGDQQSRTLLVAASDQDFEQIKSLVDQFDSPQATSSLTYRVFELRHARATEIHETVQQLLNDLMWNQEPMFFWPPMPRTQQRDRGTIAVRADARLNVLIVTGEGDRFDVVEKLIEMLDSPVADHAQRLVRLYRIQHAKVNVVAEIVTEVFGDGGRAQRRPWLLPDRSVVNVRIDEPSKTLIISASAREHDDIAELIEGIDAQVAIPDHETRVLALEFAQANEIAQTLRQFLLDRARATNAPQPSATIIASASANSLVVSAEAEDLLIIRDLLAKLDQHDVSGDRVIEIVALQDADANEIARIVREQFPRRAPGVGAQGVTITSDVRTNSLIVNAPQQQFGQVKALIDRLDSPPAADETIIRTYSLEGARAEEAQRLLAQTLQLDDRGRTPGKGITIRLEDDDALPAVEVKARIVADRRSNTLIVTATEKSFPVIESLIRRIDDVPAANPIEYRIIPLEHAMADDVSMTLRQIARALPQQPGEPAPRIEWNRFENHLIIAATADQFEQFNKIIEEIDRPAKRRRVTEFVALQFAEAQNVQTALSVFYGPTAVEADTPGKWNVRIVADPATNSLVVSAEEGEWEGIRALLKELDSEEYDASLQLRVFPLTYADSRSVARAINEAFAGTLERGRAGRQAEQRRPRAGDDDRRDDFGPTVLVEADEWVRASAEALTNSVIVSASRPNLNKIETIIEQLDVADFAKLPPPQLIPVTTGDPARIAESLKQLYEQAGPGAGADRARGGKGVLIVGDQTSNTIIVRAEEDEFRQIKALAEALQQQASEQGMSVHVLRLTSAPAMRVAGAIRDAYQAKARQTNQPLSIQVDAQGNSLIIASTGGLFREIEETAKQLDALSPGATQSIFIIELENISPEAARSVIETIGLHQRQPDDSIARIVSEPIKVSVMHGRNALIVVASPGDRETIVGLLKAIDAEPAPGLAESKVRIVRLKNSDAASVARILHEVLAPAEQHVKTPLARAVQEQVRRLAVRRDGLNEHDLNLDLTRPIRVIPDPRLNAIVIASTEENVRAIEQVIGIFDQVPITDAATVQIFPLQNISAEQFSRIVRDLFSQGRQLGALPGAAAPLVPAGVVGKALYENIAITTDERTNTVIVAGKEDAVALVEVLVKRLDSDIAAGWVEPRIVPLRYADAGDLAQTLQSVLVEGAATSPQASPLQRQVGRLRMARVEENGGRVLESDVFQPMTRLVIRPEPQLNALILVGTPVNLDVVTELVKMLDIEAASPSAAVRVYPVEHASAARLQTTITRLFDQQVQSKAIRPEDRVIVQAEERTNSLIVTTSARSFAVLESLLRTLDAEIAPDLREIRRIELAHASATRLATLVQQMMDARLDRMRRVQPETAELERATIIADPRTNALIVAAGNESFEVIQRLATDLDTTTLSDVSLVHVLPIPGASGNIDRIANAINQIMQRRYADQPAEIRTSQRPLVLTDPRTNSLLVAANPEDLAAIEDLVKKLAEAPLSPAIGLHVVSVSPGTRAEHLAPRIARLMDQRMQSLGDARTASDRVSIEPDLATNSLIIASTEENLEVIRGLIEVLVKHESDSIESPGREVEIIMLGGSSRASDMISLLNELHVREANRVRGDNAVRVTADERLNAILVNAPANDVQIIKGLIGRLDGTKPGTIIETKFISLQSANAREIVGLIENVLSGRGIGARAGSRQATVLKYVREIAKESAVVVPAVDGVAADGRPVSEDFAVEMHIGQAIRESITLTPDVRTNTVIVSAPRESMRMIERMIRDLDESSTGSQTIRIFKLVNADALAMAQILTDLFSLQRQGNLFVLRPREGPGAGIDAPMEGAAPGDPGMGMAGLSGVELTAVPDERQQLSITVDSRTNSLLVSGTPTYLDLVERVVKDLDAQEANERDVFIYQLRNAVAGEVARVLGDFVEREQQKLVSTMGTDQIGSAARLLEREITIVGDEKSNSVLVSASPRYMERVKEIIDRLDVDPPQVLIQVLFAEVTLDDSRDWGLDWQIGKPQPVRIGTPFGAAGAFLAGVGVPNLAIASTDFELLIRALEAQGRLQVLSSPTVTAANNERARIQIGETIRLPTQVHVSDLGRTQTTVEATEVGVILEVTPSINPDGFVRMDIRPEISNISARTTQISEDFEAPIIIKREAHTTVTVFDGQTIVLGGLISDRFERRDRKVPLLGDIPVFGALFRSESEERAKTELLIVLTPHVIESPAEVRRVQQLTDREIDRLTLPDEVKLHIRESGTDMSEWSLDEEGRPIPPRREEEEVQP